MKPREIDERIDREGCSGRWTSFLDAETERFETDLAARRVSLPLPQRHAWLRHTKREFRLLQLRDSSGEAALQAVVTLFRPRVGLVALAVAEKLGSAVTDEDERRGLDLLKALLRSENDIVSLRLQPRRESLRELYNFEARARRAGFKLCEPEGMTRTLLLDLGPEPEDILSNQSKKMRWNLRARHRHPVELRPITDPVFLPRCEKALAAALARTGDGSREVDLSTEFAVARDRPDLVRIIGLFFSERPDELLAFVIGHRHGASTEYAAAGSYFDPVLRKVPFNYCLVWELMLWARREGSTVFDLGGVTDGSADDPLAGISEFKRRFTVSESEVGREMAVTLRPAKRWTYEALRFFRNRLLDTPSEARA